MCVPKHGGQVGRSQGSTTEKMPGHEDEEQEEMKMMIWGISH